ncbi:MAG: hypothetical protein AAGD35_02235 [Actinomycetota bacterium]
MAQGDADTRPSTGPPIGVWIGIALLVLGPVIAITVIVLATGPAGDAGFDGTQEALEDDTGFFAVLGALFASLAVIIGAIAVGVVTSIVGVVTLIASAVAGNRRRNRLQAGSTGPPV